MDVREAHIVYPKFKMLAMLRNRQLVVMDTEIEREVAFELLLVSY